MSADIRRLVPRSFRRTIVSSILVITCILCTGAGGTVAAEPADRSIHWAYSAYFGTGWYQVQDNQEVFVARFAPRWNWGEARLDDDGRQIGVTLRIPLTFGLHDLDVQDIGGALDADNFATASLTPGVEIEYPVTKHWSLRPYAYAGWGTELDGAEHAWIYWSGVKSRYKFGHKEPAWSLLNSIGYLGYTTDDGRSSDAVPFLSGLELRLPAPFGLFHEAPLQLHLHGTYTAYLEKLRFGPRRFSDAKIAGEWEIGLAVSQGSGKIQYRQFELDRIGLAYRFSDSGNFEGVSLVFRSVFDR